MAEKKTPRVVAEWIGTAQLPAMKGTARRLTQDEIRESLVMETTRDLTWSEDHNFRADVSEESTEFVDWLKSQEEFRVIES